jgi:hypothetical protein
VVRLRRMMFQTCVRSINHVKQHGLCVTSALHEDVKHSAILIHGSPEDAFFSTNGEHDLVHMPDVTAARTVTAQFIGIGLPEFGTPLSHGFVGDDNPTLGQKLFDRSAQLSEERKYSQTAWPIISGGKR